MPFVFDNACADDDASLTSFMERLGLEVPSAWWGRAFGSPDAGLALSRPVLVRDPNGDIAAFAAMRDVTMRFQQQDISLRIIHDLHGPSDEDGTRAIMLLLDSITRDCDISLVAGCGLRTTLALASQHWQFAGGFGRWKVDADPRASGLSGPGAIKSYAETQERPFFSGKLDEIGAVYIKRTARRISWLAMNNETPSASLLESGSVAALTRRAASSRPGHEELHIVDVRFTNVPDIDAFRTIARMASETGCASYMSLFAPQWNEVIAEAGWKPLPQRWGVHWYAGRPSQRALAHDLSTCDRWFLAPIDVELDRV